MCHMYAGIATVHNPKEVNATTRKVRRRKHEKCVQRINMKDNDKDDSIEGLNENAKAARKYAVDRVVRHIAKATKVKYVVHW